MARELEHRHTLPVVPGLGLTLLRNPLSFADQKQSQSHKNMSHTTSVASHADVAHHALRSQSPRNHQNNNATHHFGRKQSVSISSKGDHGSNHGHVHTHGSHTHTLAQRTHSTPSPPTTDIVDLIRKPDACTLVEAHIHREILSGAPPSVNKKGWHGQTPLLYACVSGNLQLARLLLGNGADMSMCNNAGEGVFHVLSQIGRIDMMGMLNNYIKWDYSSKYAGMDLLRVADVRGMTPMMHAALRGQVKVMHYLHTEHNHPFHDLDRNGRTLLHCAAEMGHVLTVRYLLRHERVHVNAKTSDGRTALHIAAYHCYPDVCRVLLREDLGLLSSCDTAGKDPHVWVNKQESVTKEMNKAITTNVLNAAEYCSDESQISTQTLPSSREKTCLNFYPIMTLLIASAVLCYTNIYLRVPAVLTILGIGYKLVQPYNRPCGSNAALLRTVTTLVGLAGLALGGTLLPVLTFQDSLLSTIVVVVYVVYVGCLYTCVTRSPLPSSCQDELLPKGVIANQVLDIYPVLTRDRSASKSKSCQANIGVQLINDGHSTINLDADSNSSDADCTSDNSDEMMVEPAKAETVEDKYDRFCVTCEVMKDPKSGTTHCADCDVCVPEFDHHCAWLNTDIGGHNHVVFCYFLLFGGLLGVLYVVSYVVYVLRMYTGMELGICGGLFEVNEHHPLATWFVPVALGAVYMQWMMLYTQLHQIANSLTTKDVVNAARYGEVLKVHRSNDQRYASLSKFFGGL
ncbi:hypothetical protein SARC_05098 [Sphaeroforma arctica JP610]|uniref:Palmitoyltransferase n=1 Tax=Sphaeroforma arctica JP610 TaxID=667725 RepID=A0A0L0G1D3_9EUKA|nr:hypothetical protein SARC_05098 [Sphaeroforma arctica JP610]KNC82624.1 hypothetical protein SARC_05098 [Sphaeroforma arctica JP610]|eukprot:XP_014156526.1 hypothetical protein SARC_05098 [Sphaeroforma arctica JP610]